MYPAASKRIFGHKEVIPEQHLLAAESEFSSEIAASNARHRIALRPSPGKSSSQNVGFHGINPVIAATSRCNSHYTLGV
jgi:hypothetical protein